jgi:predicted deacetylase
MNWSVWDQIETHIIRHHIRPILSVIPDNHDRKLFVDPPNGYFWERVRGWQSQGFTIAMHGYQHRYVNSNPGLMRLWPSSEFAGLPYRDQEKSLREALEIFANHGIRADAWVAPSHSFDKATVAILASLGIRVFSDGLWRWPFSDQLGIMWVPQQLWDFKEKRRGIWTVCFHHNFWDASQLQKFGERLDQFAARITDLDTVIRSFSGRQLTVRDRFDAGMDLIWNHRLRPLLRSAAWWRMSLFLCVSL